MSTAVTHSVEFDRNEPIPGYRTEKLLGRGGCGEVWRAVAPGGIAKAIKIVYGDNDSSHADTEMRALARVKDVRHPLLLSIERIEIVHGNLVIVTELADYSLKDHYTRLRQAQSVGVPHEELLKYISDAAEILDYLYANYSLQHLDVKPENILIVSGRAKLGDFGLVKNLYERGGSLVGGLTPTYAPPELFEGRPSRHSDQYSLAIVYAQMLTGVLPFAANNTAQLASQHLHGVPDLSALPRQQRSVVARALSKDPALRFESCTALVAALKEATASAAACRSDRDAADSPAAAAQAVSALPRETMRRGNLPTVAPLRSIDSRSAAAYAADSNPAERPVIVVGVGGAGVEVLARFVDRLNDRFGGIANWPAIECLAIDSNSHALSSRFPVQVLERVQVVPIPLKPAESYGSQSAGVLKWLGRRWFYNIPRDLTTGGYRPLGRLALLTHAARIREAVASVVSRTAGRAPAPAAPRVILVGSICGGTGSGALFDLSYALRSELKRAGLSDEHVHGVLLHASSRSNAERDKARANAYAALHELNHYSCPGSHYPAEPALNTPPFHGDNATFARTHLINLGDGLGQAEWDLAADQVAEFVYCVACTPASRILDADQQRDVGPNQVQSYDILSLGAGNGAAVAEIVQLAQNDVVRLWREGRQAAADPSASSVTERTANLHPFATFANPPPAEVDQAVKLQFSEIQLDFNDFLNDAAEVVKLEMGGSIDEFLGKLVDDCLAAAPAAQAGTARTDTVLAMIGKYLASNFDDGLEEEGDDRFFSQIVGRLSVRTRNRTNALLEWIRSLVNLPDVRIAAARNHAVAAQQLLQTLQETSLQQAIALHGTALDIGLAARSDQNQGAERSRFAGWSLRKKAPADKSREALKTYAKTCLNELFRRAAAKVSRIVIAEISTLIEQLDRLSRELMRLAGPMQAAPPAGQASDREAAHDSRAALSAYRRLLCEQLRLRRYDMARRIDELIESTVLGAGNGIRRFLDSEVELETLLGKPLADAARRTVLENIEQINVQLVAACGSESGCQAMLELGEAIASNLADAGKTIAAGVAQSVLIVPAEADPTRLMEQVEAQTDSAMVIQGRKCDVTLCGVHHPAPLVQAASQIIGGVEQYKELASRLHARVDISWRQFTRPAATDHQLPAFEPPPGEDVSNTFVLQS
ncbi:MAG: protein kinase [Planctomycetia bacterium]|nr:protein kinase [Planctomycetia bacterium]